MRKSLVMGSLVGALALTVPSGAGERAWYVAFDGGASWGDVEPVILSYFFQVPNCGQLVCGLTPILPEGATLLSPLPASSTETGLAIVGAVGVGITDDIRVEGEAGYRQMGYDQDGDFAIETALVNVIYDIGLTDALELSFGVGAGAAFVSFDPGAGTGQSDQATLAYQGIAGLSYEIADGTHLTATYRYTAFNETTDAEWQIPSRVITLDDLTTSTVSVGLRIDL